MSRWTLRWHQYLHGSLWRGARTLCLLWHSCGKHSLYQVEIRCDRMTLTAIRLDETVKLCAITSFKLCKEFCHRPSTIAEGVTSVGSGLFMVPRTLNRNSAEQTLSQRATSRMITTRASLLRPGVTYRDPPRCLGLAVGVVILQRIKAPIWELLAFQSWV